MSKIMRKKGPVEERIVVREEIKTLEKEINRIKDHIAGKEKQAAGDWHKYKQTGHKKHFISAGEKYKERNKMKSALQALEQEKEFYQNKWNRLKKAA